MNVDPESELAVRLKLLAAQRRLERAEKERDLVVAEAEDVRRRLAEAVEAKAEIESSVRFKVGSLLAEAVRNPGRLFGNALRSLRKTEAGGAGQGEADALRFDAARQHAGDAVAGETVDVDAAGVVVHALPAPTDPPQALCSLRVASVLDAFSHESLAPECQLVALTPEDWAGRIREHRPHMLLVESAWLGRDGEWQGLVERAPEVLRSLVASCRAAGIPTVFWNKEDPVHFEAFVETAGLFDHVLTTDASSIPRYRRILGQASVGLLPFGFQPRTHHPVGDEARRSAAVFAGAWYGNMPDRCADFLAVADPLALAGPLVIHDRHDGKGAPHQQFPSRFRDAVRPKVSYAETASLYRSYRIGVNLNTVKQSPSMFARRVLEMIGCNVSVYGNFSLAVRMLLGDLTVSTDDAETLLAQAWTELQRPDDERFRERRLVALRKVLGQHTWAHRLQVIAKRATGVDMPVSPGRVKVLAKVRTQAQADAVVAAFVGQSLAAKLLVMEAGSEVQLPAWVERFQEARWDADDWVAVFHPDDVYARHYLEDLALARAFGLGDALGKACWSEAGADGAVRLQGAGMEYRLVDRLALRRGLFRAAVHSPDTLFAMLDDEDAHVEGGALVSTDASGYLMRGASFGAAGWPGAASALDQGMEVDDLLAMAETLGAEPDATQAGERAFDGHLIAALFNAGVMPAGTSARASFSGAEICSLLPVGEEDALFSAPIPRDRIERDGRVKLEAQYTGGNALDLYLDAMAAEGRVATRHRLRDGLHLDVPAPGPEVLDYRLAATVRGRFVHHVKGLWREAPPANPLLLPGTRRLLLVCNGYPESGRLYRNGFLHRRVLAYRAAGLQVDVVVVAPGESPRAYEYEGVLVQVCTPGVLGETVARSAHTAIAVHFLDEAVWSALSRAPAERRIVVWIHGAEIQSPGRRRFNYRDEVALQAAVESTRQRDAFWRALFQDRREGLRFVFVSRTFAEEVWTDLGVRCADGRWCVIHNPIDTGLFQGPPKDPAQRLKVLSVRPHDAPIYANDLVGQAIELMSADEDFASLSFELVGDGALWEENFGGLDRHANVSLRREFLRQGEVAGLHRNHGVFLVPTRGDTQGVSRDEAMSSGLVPVTCRVGSVAEFVDDDSGILCPPEDPRALADAVLSLAKDPVLFSRLSGGASARVRRQSGVDVVLPQELRMLGERVRGD